MGHLPYDFQLWNALVNLLKDRGVNNPSQAVGCWRHDDEPRYHVRTARGVRKALAMSLSGLLGREFSLDDSVWTLFPNEAITVVRTDII